MVWKILTEFVGWTPPDILGGLIVLCDDLCFKNEPVVFADDSYGCRMPVAFCCFLAWKKLVTIRDWLLLLLGSGRWRFVVLGLRPWNPFLENLANVAIFKDGA